MLFTALNTQVFKNIFVLVLFYYVWIFNYGYGMYKVIFNRVKLKYLTSKPEHDNMFLASLFENDFKLMQINANCSVYTIFVSFNSQLVNVKF